MTQERFEMEDRVLAYYLPRNMFRFRDMNTSSPYLQAGVVTNDGACYVLHFKLNGFPYTKPEVYVEEMLRTKSGELSPSISGCAYTSEAEFIEPELIPTNTPSKLFILSLSPIS